MCKPTPLSSVSRAGECNTYVAKNKKIFSSETIVSQNLLGLKSEERVEELFYTLRKRKLFCICVQETWRAGKQSLENEGSVLLLSGQEENEMRSHRGEQGVGIALSAEATDAWKKGGKILHDDFEGRLIAVRMLVKDERERDVGLFLISAYCPVGNADQDQWEVFFERLRSCISRKEVDDILIIGIDANSSLGTVKREKQEVMASVGPFGNPHVNASGIRFRSFLEVNNLAAVTTFFQKKQYSTWNHPRSKKPHQIDHFITEKSSISRFLDAGCTSPILYSDHLGISCKLRICARLKKRSLNNRQQLLRLDASKLKEEETRLQFCRSVREQFDAAAEGESYDNLKTAIESSAREILPKKPKAQPQWFLMEEEKISRLIEERNNAMKEAVGHRTRSRTLRLRKARRELKTVIREIKNKWIQQKCDVMNDSSSKNGTAGCWKALKELKNGLTKTRPTASQMMTKSDGSKCTTPAENAEVFREHFEKLFDRVPTFSEEAASMIEQLPVRDEYGEEPDDDEIRAACRRLKEKAPGDSGLLPQFWKALSSEPSTFDLIKQLILNFWRSEQPPRDWLIGLLKILPKKGDLSQAGNYRGIMLLEAAYKIVSILLLNRLQPIAESLDQEQQCGFRPGRGCQDAIFNVKMAIKKRREHGQETWILFLDLVKAFDRVPRELLWKILEKYGVPVKLMRLLRALHQDVTVKFEAEGHVHVVICSIGVKQGDILGPVLFIIFMVAVMTSWRATSDQPHCLFLSKHDDILTGRKHTSRGDEYAVDDSEYADDTGMLFVSRQALDKYAPLLVKHFAIFGMEIHVGDVRTPEKKSKTEVLFVAAPARCYQDKSSYDNADLSNVDLGGGHYFPIVDKFCYLGSFFTRDGRDDTDVKYHIDSAGGAFGDLRKPLFSNASVDFASKRVVYEGQILMILLYACESWCLTEKLLNLLRSFHARCVRAMCRVNRLHVRMHRITTAELLERLGLRTLDAYVHRRQLQWAGHVLRMPYERIPRKMMTCWVPERRPVGCPEFTYGRGLYKALKNAGVDKEDWSTLAEDRENWRRTISHLK